MRGPSRSVALGLSGWLASSLAFFALFVRADARPRHIYVVGLSDGDVATIVSPSTGEPVGVVAGGDVIPPPTGGAQREDEAMLRAPPEGTSGGAAPAEVHPDRLTDTVTSTDYFEAFTPAVAPYKRVASYDAVRLDADGTPVLVVSDAASQAVPILGASPDSNGVRDAFWGTVMLDFRRGMRVAIPSVAPDARILHARTEPAIDFVVEADVAGNYFVRALESGAGIVRFTFLTDASRGFFGRSPPSHRADALLAQVPPVPASIRERGVRFAAELGIAPGMPVDRSLDRLVEHFRAFVESDAMPSPSGDTYLDLARGRVGVCRHRAYAFVVTALALGIPANYVQNEAHAWVEVRLRDGYLRIDLGGSAQGVNAHGLQDRPRHDVAAADPFPQPEVFVRDYLERGVAPERSPRAPGGDEPGGSESASNGSSSTQGNAGANGANGASAGGTASNGASSEASAPAGEGPEPGDEASSSAADAGTNQDTRRPTTLSIDADSMRVYRGQMLDIAGELVALGETRAPVAQGRIEFRVEGGRLLGVALTDERGRFAISLGIPPDLGVGRHAMEIAFRGDRERLPTRAP